MEYLMITKTTTRTVKVLHKDVLYDVIIDFEVSEEEITKNVYEQLWRKEKRKPPKRWRW